MSASKQLQSAAKPIKTKMRFYKKLLITLAAIVLSTPILMTIANFWLIHQPWFNFGIVAKKIKAEVRVNNALTMTGRSISVVKTQHGSKFTFSATNVIAMNSWSKKSQSARIKIRSALLDNLIRPGLQFVAPPKDWGKFAEVVGQETDEYLAGRKPRADLAEFIGICQSIIDRHLTYSVASKGWQSYDPSSGVFHFQWSNPLTFKEAFTSVDGITANELTAGQHEAVCRHYVEEFVWISEELKKQHPKEYSNFYIVPLYYPMSWHMPALAVNVTGSKSCEVTGFDPTFAPSETFDPTFAVLQELYLRNLITKETCILLSETYEKEGGQLDAKDHLGLDGLVKL